MSQTNAEWLKWFIENQVEAFGDLDSADRLRAILTELERPTFEARFEQVGWERLFVGTEGSLLPAEWAARLGWTPQPGEVVQVTVRKGGEG